jgi:hypothetical protein
MLPPKRKKNKSLQYQSRKVNRKTKETTGKAFTDSFYKYLLSTYYVPDAEIQ